MVVSNLTSDVSGRRRRGAALTLESRIDRARRHAREALHTYLAWATSARRRWKAWAARPTSTNGRHAANGAAAGALRPSAETDRVFLGAHDRCIVVDPVLGGASSSTSTSRRPRLCGTRGATGPPDGGPGADQWTSMLCVEAANAMDAARPARAGSRARDGRGDQCGAAGPTQRRSQQCGGRGGHAPGAESQNLLRLSIRARRRRARPASRPAREQVAVTHAPRPRR